MGNQDEQLENTQEDMVNASEMPETVQGEMPSTHPETEPSTEAQVSVESAAAPEDLSSAEVGSSGTGESASESAPSVAELQQQIEDLQQQLEDRNSQFMRTMADFENFRKRTQREKEDLELQAKCATVVELLPVVDNFERARSQIKPQGDEAIAIHKSYQGVYKDFVERLKRIGVAPMRSEGKEFDPNLHEAVLREPSSEYAEGVVLEELVRGYLLGDRVLRHAMVKVAAPPETAEETSDSNA